MIIYPAASPATGISQSNQEGTNPTAETKDHFSTLISSHIEQVNDAQQAADDAIAKLHSGEAQNLHDVMIAVEQADLSLRMLVQIRNKALSAYDEIMRMQI